MNRQLVTTTSEGFTPYRDCEDCENETRSSNERCRNCQGNERQNSERGCESPVGFCPPKQCPCSPEQVVKDECCRGIRPTDGNGMRTGFIPAYVDTLFDEREVEGRQIPDSISISSEGCQFSAVYRNCNGCCTDSPNITSDSCFHVEAFETRILMATPARKLVNTDFLINNIAPNANGVDDSGLDNYRVALSAFDSDIFKQLCRDKGLGSRDSVVIAPNGVAISYMVEYVLCGYVSTEDGSFSFEITLSNNCPKTTNNTTSYFVPKLCIPETDCHSQGFLKTALCFEAEGVAPTLRANDDGDIELNDTVILTPSALVETVINKKVMLAVGCER